MYDYLAKVILLGPSGTGKSVVSLSLISPWAHIHIHRCRSCLLHRIVKNECE